MPINNGRREAQAMDPNYLTTPTTLFGPAEWVFFVASIATALGGIYLAFLRSDENAIRKSALLPVGYVLIVAGLVGVVIGALPLSGLALAPFWMTIATIVLLAAGAYGIYVATALVPQRLAAAQSAQRSRGTARGSAQRAAAQPRTNGTVAPVAGAAPAAGSRRESRRERKRRGK
jgi:hypothetical protein